MFYFVKQALFISNILNNANHPIAYANYLYKLTC